jgi:endoglucanase
MIEFEKPDKTFLKDLLEASSPSGQEQKAIGIWKKFLKDNLPFKALPLDYYQDRMGNCARSVGTGNTKLLLSGHIDQVNARVSLIHDSGLISIHYTGGIDNRCLPGSKVSILLDSGEELEGAVIKQAMHLDENDKWPENHCDMSQMKIDIGAESKEEVLELGIHPGSLVCYRPEVNLEFGKNRICSTSLDDKIAVFIVAEVLKALGEDCASCGTYIPEDHWSKRYQVIGLSATQEETGLRGATVAAHEINPDISLDIDVDFASDDEMSGPKEKIGDIKLGSGPIIAWGCDKSPRINVILKDLAKEKDIKIQEVSTTAGGTNTEVLQLYSKNCETAHLAIPNRSMHSQNEVCDWRDIKGAIELITSAITEKKL